LKVLILLVLFPLGLLGHYSLGAPSSVGLALPLSHDAVALPVFREHLPNVYLVELLAPILEAHAPSTIRLLGLKHVLELFLEGPALVPVIGIFAEGTVPNAIASPRIPNSDELQVLFGKLSKVQDTVEVILEDALGSLIGSLRRFLHVVVHTTQIKLLIEVTEQHVPEASIVNGLLNLIMGEVKALAYSTGEIHKPLQDIPLANRLVATVKLYVSLLNQRNPEFLRVGAAAVHACS